MGMKTSRTNFSLAWIVNRCRINRTSRQPWIKTMVEEMEEKSRGTVAFSLFSTLSGYTTPPLRLGHPLRASFVHHRAQPLNLRRGEIYTKT